MRSSLQTICLVLTIGQLHAKRDFTVEILNGTLTTPDSEYARSLNFNIYDGKSVYIDFTLCKNITEFDMKIKVSLIKKDNRPTNFMNFQMNGCKSMEGGLKSNILKVLYKEMYRVTNIPKTCPVLADTLYTLNNFTLRDDDFPIIVPIVEWKFVIDFLIGEKVKATMFVHGRIRKL